MTGQLRCAIYTRKSTDEGLEQDFNSLHAQREACEAFVLSQRHEGWKALKDQFDDGGFSGGTIQRPGLSRLLEMIKQGKIDVLVVYKVDRLTRSLADFAKMVELFDEHKVSFVSVTQQFNTTTSMGRLTLNVLLSFAQFEREVDAERIRDKIAASKKRGIWMGGSVPLGYDVRKRQLIVNKQEAKTVQQLFSLYLKLGTVKHLAAEACRRGLKTKSRIVKGRCSGGGPFTRSHLYYLLTNPTYIGEIPHKGVTYPGQHKAIISKDTWSAVQRSLKENAVIRQSVHNVKSGSLLSGLVFDEAGEPLYTAQTSKNGRRHRYYVSKQIVRKGREAKGGLRIPAAQLECVVKKTLCEFLGNGIRVIETLHLRKASPALQKKATSKSSEIAKAWETDTDFVGQPSNQLRQLLRKITASDGRLVIELKYDELCQTLIGQSAETSDRHDNAVTLESSITLKRRGVETKLIMLSTNDGTGQSPDDKLIQLVARSSRWLDELTNGTATSIRQLAAAREIDENDISRFIGLAFLAPNIVEAIVAGLHPPELTSERLKGHRLLPHPWAAQQRLLNFRSQF